MTTTTPDKLVNGAPYGLGPFRVDLTGFARSMPSLHQLLPEYACLEQRRDLVKTTEVTLPELDTAMVAGEAPGSSWIRAEHRRSEGRYAVPRIHVELRRVPDRSP